LLFQRTGVKSQWPSGPIEIVILFTVTFDVIIAMFSKHFIEVMEVYRGSIERWSASAYEICNLELKLEPKSLGAVCNASTSSIDRMLFARKDTADRSSDWGDAHIVVLSFMEVIGTHRHLYKCFAINTTCAYSAAHIHTTIACMIRRQERKQGLRYHESPVICGEAIGQEHNLCLRKL
jgi:hypothetical protein